jgi:D-alanine-D-alanine ligase
MAWLICQAYHNAEQMNPNQEKLTEMVSGTNQKVIIFHSPLKDDASLDELDVLDEVEYMGDGLRSLGYSLEIMPFPYDLDSIDTIITKISPVFVVNLVETVYGDGRLVHLAPAIFDHFHMPYTGCGSDAIYLTSNKVLAKRIMLANGIPTPACFSFADIMHKADMDMHGSYIVKSIWEHASFGLDEREKMLYDHADELLKKFSDPGSRMMDYFAESYIHGREFNVSLLASNKLPEILPVAEMCFDYPADKPRIVGYQAKWEVDSFEYQHTTRHFLQEGTETQLVNSLREVSLQCWKVFGLQGYARVDFRVSEEGDIYVLEINANPCVSENSGYVAALENAGITREEMMKRIIADMDQYDVY